MVKSVSSNGFWSFFFLMNIIARKLTRNNFCGSKGTDHHHHSIILTIRLQNSYSWELQFTHFTVFSDDAKEISLNKTVIELDNAWVVKSWKKSGFMHSIYCFIWLQLSHWNLLKDFPGHRKEHYNCWIIHFNILKTDSLNMYSCNILYFHLTHKTSNKYSKLTCFRITKLAYILSYLFVIFTVVFVLNLL